MQLLSVRSFAKLVREEFNSRKPQVFALICCASLSDNPTQAGRIQVAVAGHKGRLLSQVLPIEL